MELQNNQYSHLYMEYTTRQNNARYELEQKYKEVISILPDIENLDYKISELSVIAATKALEGDEKYLQQLKKNIVKISKEKEFLLTSNGYPSNYLTYSYICDDCQDTGYIKNEKCHCFKKSIVNYLYSQSNIKKILETENFSNFSIEYYPDDFIEETTGLTPKDNIQNVLRTAHEFLDHFDTNHDNLLLYGSTGVGKTFLSHCIAKELLDSSHTVVYLTSLEFFDILEKYKFDRDLSTKEKHATLAYILDCDLLILDDLGTELNNSFVSSSLYHCIDSRLLKERSTIISTNLSFDDLCNHYSERIFSRITSHYSLLKITGTDIRFQKALGK